MNKNHKIKQVKKPRATKIFHKSQIIKIKMIKQMKARMEIYNQMEI